VILLLFFSYGHVYELTKTWTFQGYALGRHRILLSLWGIIFFIWIWWVGLKMKSLRIATQFFAFISVAAIIPPAYQVLSRSVQINSNPVNVQTNTIPSFGDTAFLGTTLPDIYYIILDGYARADVLKELYGYDNSDFLRFLTDRGFYVAERSKSNYSLTVLSLSSSLNMDYIQVLKNPNTSTTGFDKILRELIQHSQVRKFLETAGYQTLAFDTGFPHTQIFDADYYWVAPPSKTRVFSNAFETLLAETTILRSLFDLCLVDSKIARLGLFCPDYESHQNRVLYILSKLKEVTKLDGNFFVFAHIISPHPPFVFGKQGELQSPNTSFSFNDGDHFRGTQEEYLQKYVAQLQFLNSQLKGAIDNILEASTNPPIIILQADHGPGAYLEWESLEQSNIKERMSILNAFYFPDGNYEALYPTITPANTFRIVINHHLNTQFKLLDDRSYFSTFKNRYDFIDITDRIGEHDPGSPPPLFVSITSQALIVDGGATARLSTE
jgi:hypothetical protein